MNKSKRLSVGQQVLITFAALCAIILMLGGLFFFSLRSIERSNQLQQSRALGKVDMINEVSLKVAQLQVEVLQQLLASDRGEIERLDLSIHRIQELAARHFGDYQKTVETDPERQLYDRVLRARLVYWEQTRSLMAFRRLKRDGAESMTTKQAPAYAGLEKALRAVHKYADANTGETARAAAAFISQSRVMGNALVGSAIVLTIAAGFSLAAIASKLSEDNRLLQIEVCQRKQAEETLRHSDAALRRKQAEMRVLFDLIPAMVLFKDTQDVILRVNRLVAESSGKSVEEIEGRPTAEIFPREAARFRAEDLEVIHSGTARLGIVNTVLDGEGTERWVQTDKVPYCDRDGKVLGIVVLTQDITARRQAEESLRLLGSAVDQSHESIVITDAQLDVPGPRIVFVNPAFTRMTGYTVEEVLGKTPRILQGPHSDRAELSRLRQTLERGEAFAGQSINYRKDGTEYTQEWQIAPILGADGMVTHFVSIQRDISARKRLEAQLFQSQKLETVGKLAGGIAHEFNSILTTILGHSELLLNALPSGPLSSNATEIRQAAERAATLTRQLLAYGGKQILQPETLDLGSVLANLQCTLGHLMGRGVEVRCPPAVGLRFVKADAGQIGQVIMNIAMNAADAMPDGGTLTLETANVTLDQKYVSRIPGLKAGEYVMLAITDTGAGLSEEVKSRAFEPFFSTKGVGEGTGLGLSTCFGIVKQSGGHISLHSEGGQGATFTIYLPQVEAQPTKSPGQQLDPAELPRGTETILLVEDDAALRELAATLLRRLGYMVLTAANGIEALSLKHQPDVGTIDLLFTDVVIPHMSGKELAERVLAESPHTRILFTSAYTGNASVHQGGLNKEVMLLKPFTPSALAYKVREALREPLVAV